MGCFIFISIQMLPKRGMSAGKQVLQPMPERFSAALGFLYVKQGLAKGVAGDLCIKNLLSAVLPSWKVSE